MVEWHLAGCDACRNDERDLRESHECLAGASIAASSAPPDLKTRVLDALPGGTIRGGRTGRRRGRAAAAVLLLFALAVVAYSAGLFDQSAESATLAPTDLAPGAGGELRMRGSGTDMQASLEVWGLPRTDQNEYYELWFGRDEGRVSAGTFTVDDRGRGELSTLCPEVAGGYQRAGITLEKFPEEPRMDSASVVLRSELQGS